MKGIITEMSFWRKLKGFETSAPFSQSILLLIDFMNFLVRFVKAVITYLINYTSGNGKQTEIHSNA